MLLVLPMQLHGSMLPMLVEGSLQVPAALVPGDTEILGFMCLFDSEDNERYCILWLLASFS